MMSAGMAGPTEERPRQKGFVLVLVVDGAQASGDHDAIARVCNDYDVQCADGIAAEIRAAAERACNQLALRSAMGRVLRRAAGG